MVFFQLILFFNIHRYRKKNELYRFRDVHLNWIFFVVVVSYIYLFISINIYTNQMRSNDLWIYDYGWRIIHLLISSFYDLNSKWWSTKKKEKEKSINIAIYIEFKMWTICVCWWMDWSIIMMNFIFIISWPFIHPIIMIHDVITNVDTPQPNIVNDF